MTVNAISLMKCYVYGASIIRRLRGGASHQPYKQTETIRTYQRLAQVRQPSDVEPLHSMAHTMLHRTASPFPAPFGMMVQAQSATDAMYRLWVENQALHSSLAQSAQHIAELEAEVTCLRAHQAVTGTHGAAQDDGLATAVTPVASHAHVVDSLYVDDASPAQEPGAAQAVMRDKPVAAIPQPAAAGEKTLKGRLTHHERMRMDLFIQLVRARQITVRRGDLSRDLQQFVNPQRSRGYFEKLVSRLALNNLLSTVLGPRDKRKRTSDDRNSEA